MPPILQSNSQPSWTRTVVEFLTALGRKIAAFFAAPPSEADRRDAEKKRQKEIRRRLRGL